MYKSLKKSKKLNRNTILSISTKETGTKEKKIFKENPMDGEYIGGETERSTKASFVMVNMMGWGFISFLRRRNTMESSNRER